MAAQDIASTSALDTSDREIVITRTFDAPRELVFAVWTRPEHVARWFGPNGFTITTKTMDVKPGGVWRFTMHGPDGTDYPNLITYVEVVKPERLVYAQGSDEQPEQFRVTATFEEHRGRTKLTMRMLFPTAADRDYVVREFNAIEGGQQTLERLGALLATIAEPRGREFVISRLVDAPRELVFRAWTDAEKMAQWFAPRGFTNPVCELDARTGGSYRIVMRSPDGIEYGLKGTYLEVVPPARLVYTENWEDHPEDFHRAVRELAPGVTSHEGETTVTFDDQDGKTLITIRSRFESTEVRDAHVKMGMADGWDEFLDRMEEVLR